MLYRILTEDKNRNAIERIVGAEFPGFTLIPTQGYWQGEKEMSLVIEIAAEESGSRAKVYEVARTIKLVNGQQAVMVQAFDLETVLV